MFKLGDNVFYVATGAEWYIDRWKVRQGLIVAKDSLGSRIRDTDSEEIVYYQNTSIFIDHKDALLHCRNYHVEMVRRIDNELAR